MEGARPGPEGLARSAVEPASGAQGSGRARSDAAERRTQPAGSVPFDTSFTTVGVEPGWPSRTTSLQHGRASRALLPWHNGQAEPEAAMPRVHTSRTVAVAGTAARWPSSASATPALRNTDMDTLRRSFMADVRCAPESRD